MGITILCVDDNPVYMESYVEGLRMRVPSAEIHTRDTADKFLSMIEDGSAREYSIIILDLMMAVGDKLPKKLDAHVMLPSGLNTGLLLYEELRKSSATNPVIILSSNLDKISLDEVAARDSKFAALPKALTRPSHLAEKIMHLLNAR